jgi:hypothetical protein
MHALTIGTNTQIFEGIFKTTAVISFQLRMYIHTVTVGVKQNEFLVLLDEEVYFLSLSLSLST